MSPNTSAARPSRSTQPGHHSRCSAVAARRTQQAGSAESPLEFPIGRRSDPSMYWALPARVHAGVNVEMPAETHTRPEAGLIVRPRPSDL